MSRPILYSFRRCPYAMRARLAVQSAGVTCELREILLRDKAPEFLAASAKGTVPVIVTQDGATLEESFEIMHWALTANDPERWLHPGFGNLESAVSLIKTADGDFKHNLDRYKYASRFDTGESTKARDRAADFLAGLDGRLTENSYLFGNRICIADMAIAPFVRQFASVDRDWFDALPLPRLHRWLEDFLNSQRFASVMQKYPKWRSGDPVTLFPERP